MTFINRRAIFICLYFLCPLLVFSAGSNGGGWPGPGEMRLNIINQTNDAIKLYLNRLDVSITVNADDRYESGTLLMDFNNTYPLYIGVEFSNTITKCYIFKREIPPKSIKRLFYAIFYHERMYFFDEAAYSIGHLTKIEENPGTANVQDSSEWNDYVSPGTRYDTLELLLINDTMMKRNVVFNDSINELYYELDAGEARLIKIAGPIFIQGNTYENIDYKYYTIETENLLHSGGIYSNPIRLEDGLQIMRMVETGSGITIVGL
jgi:hypothetical protein